MMCVGTHQAHAQSTWRRTYGGYGSNVGNSIRQTEDGGYVIAGSTGSFGVGGDAYLIKIDPDGLPIWSGSYGGDGVQTGVACRELADGYILAGTTSLGDHGGYDLFMVRIDDNSNVVWQRSYGTDEWDICMDLEVTSDGFVLVGTTYSGDQGDAYVVRTDLNGDTIWTRTLGGAFLDEGRGALVLSDDGIIVTGSTSVNADDADGFVSKLDADGVQTWFTTFGGDSADYLHSAVETLDGGFACSGSTKSYSDVLQVLVCKVDADGNSVWQHEYGSMGDSEAAEIQVDPNGGFAMASYNSYANAGGTDMVLFLISETGDFILGKNYGGIGDETGISLQCNPDGGYTIVGTAEEYGPGVRSIFVVRCDSTGETADDTVYEMFDPLDIVSVGSTKSPAVRLFPNPASIETRWTADRIYDHMRLVGPDGRIVRAWDGLIPNTLALSGLSSGLYNVRLWDDAGNATTIPLVIQAP